MGIESREGPDREASAQTRRPRSSRSRQKGLARLAVATLVLIALLSAGALALTHNPGHPPRARPRPVTVERAASPPPSPSRPRPARRPVPIRAPVIAQQLHNDCEAAALEVLLASVRVRVDQRQLLREIPRNGPLDPVYRGGGRVWGDPELGFVGRADGGGAEGGFGVYQRPVAAVAARHGRVLADLTGRPRASIYDRVRAGHAVMAWVALSDGPYATWRSPRGRTVRVNLGEHTIVLTGVTKRSVALVNPLEGTREVWARTTFEARWRALGRRALSTG